MIFSPSSPRSPRFHQSSRSFVDVVNENNRAAIKWRHVIFQNNPVPFPPYYPFPDLGWIVAINENNRDTLA